MSFVESGITPEDVLYVLQAICCLAMLAVPGVPTILLGIGFLMSGRSEEYHMGGDPFGTFKH